MTRSARKITFIGAGSTVFAKKLIGRHPLISRTRGLDNLLYDIDENRLKTSEVVAKRIANTLGPSPIEVTTDRSRALEAPLMRST